MTTPFELMLPPPEHPAYDPATDHDQDQAHGRLDRRRIPTFGTRPRNEAPHYQVDDDLRTAINMALVTGSPLLLTGEPGTGKTMVAHHLAWYFGLPEPFTYVVRSDAEAADLKYDFDAVAYLRDANDTQSPERPRDDPAYLTRHALWRAYDHSREHGPCVLLIDEIDKAPRDFPNDLLLELERHRFPHPFKPGREHDIRADPDCPPIVIVTSNAERHLPNAFLRRCIYHHIELSPALLRKAVDAHLERGRDDLRLPPEVVDAALLRVGELRKDDLLTKKPSTAEVLVWLTLLAARGGDTGRLLQDLEPARLDQLPLISALIKHKQDLDQLGRG